MYINVLCKTIIFTGMSLPCIELTSFKVFKKIFKRDFN